MRFLEDEHRELTIFDYRVHDFGRGKATKGAPHAQIQADDCRVSGNGGAKE